MNLRAALLGLCGLLVVAACGTKVYLSSPTASPTLQPLPSAVPSAAGITPTPLPTAPSPSPSPIAVSESAELFLALFSGVAPPFHVRIDTTLTGVPGGTAIEEADVDGAAYSAELHVELDGLEPRDSQVVFIGGTAYVADAGTSIWQAYADYESLPPVNPFLDFDPLAWQAAGADPAHAGLERVHSTTWQLPAGSQLASRLTDDSFDVWLDSGGLPVDGDLTFSLAAINGGTAVGYRALYEFSKVGEPVEIVAPSASPSASP